MNSNQKDGNRTLWSRASGESDEQHRDRQGFYEQGAHGNKPVTRTSRRTSPWPFVHKDFL